MPVYNLVFWQNIPSPHQMPVLRELAKMGHEVTLIVDQMELEQRKSMGWNMPDTTGVNLATADDVSIEELVARQHNDTINIPSGVRGVDSGLAVARACTRYGKRFGFIAEPGDPRGAKGCLRRLIYTVDALKYRKNIDFILAMGQTGVDWYTSSGYLQKKVFHYSYVVDDMENFFVPAPDEKFRICFAGSLVQLKRVDLLIRSLAGLSGKCALSIVGDGPEKEMLQHLVDGLAVKNDIRWMGYVEHENALKHIGASDLLVLPSDYDGWGAVVNEALMLGVPVVCSDKCGASDLFVGSDEVGQVFTSGSVVSLQNALESMMGRGKPNAEMRRCIRDWARCISAESVAEYFTKILDHTYSSGQRPIAPWRVQL